MLEWYRLGFDAERLMAEVAALVDLVLGPAPVRTVTYVELAGPAGWPREDLDLEFSDAVRELGGRVFVTEYPAARLRSRDRSGKPAGCGALRAGGRRDRDRQRLSRARRRGLTKRLWVKRETDRRMRAAGRKTGARARRAFLAALAAGLPGLRPARRSRSTGC